MTWRWNRKWAIWSYFENCSGLVTSHWTKVTCITSFDSIHPSIQKQPSLIQWVLKDHLLGAKLFSQLCQCGKPPLLPHIRDAHPVRMETIFAPCFKMFLLCPCSKETNSKSLSKTLRRARHKADCISNLWGFQRGIFCRIYSLVKQWTYLHVAAKWAFHWFDEKCQDWRLKTKRAFCPAVHCKGYILSPPLSWGHAAQAPSSSNAVRKSVVRTDCDIFNLQML